MRPRLKRSPRRTAAGFFVAIVWQPSRASVADRGIPVRHLVYERSAQTSLSHIPPLATNRPPRRRRDTPQPQAHFRGRHGNARMIVWIWDASGPAADACGVAGTAEAARRAAGARVTSELMEAGRVGDTAGVLSV